MKQTTRWLFAITALFFTLNLRAQNEATPDFVIHRLDDYVAEALEKWNIPGVAVAVVKDGEIVVSKGYGLRHHQSDAPVDEHTLFMIASNTKAFAGTAIALLAEEGRLSQDDKVSKFVPGFRMYHPEITNKVTVRDLLTHRLGLQTFQGDFLYFYSNLQKKDVYNKFPLIEPSYTFRDRYGYCNAGYF
jgi:CubicO group peptidase (beta-lactamase class C family)